MEKDTFVILKQFYSGRKAGSSGRVVRTFVNEEGETMVDVLFARKLTYNAPIVKAVPLDLLTVPRSM